MPRTRRLQATSVFGRRLRQARLQRGLPQDQLGVLIGLDEGTASARISRYETGAHEPPLAIAGLLARALELPLAFFYCDDDELAQMIQAIVHLPSPSRKLLWGWLQEQKPAATAASRPLVFRKSSRG